MYMYGESHICDYVTLYFADGTLTLANGNRTFNVPTASYMFTNRGQYCLVSMVDGSFLRTAESDSVTVGYVGAMNAGGSDMTQPAILGHFNQAVQHGNNDYKHEFIPNNIKLLTQARPSQIVLSFRSASDKSVVSSNNGYVTLKFEYLSKKQVAMMFDEEETMVAF